MKTRGVIVVGFITILTAGFAYSQGTSPLGRANIPFKFMVGKKEMPAGKYEFARHVGNNTRLLLRNLDTKNSLYVPVVERLAETHPSEKHPPRIVFDTVGEQKFLSEFWPADNADGYLLGVTKGEQKHEIVNEQ